MNEVYLRGKLVSMYATEVSTSQTKHLVYQLQVSHKNAQQQVKFENYTVNAWRNLAVWASANLQIGMEVFVRGHLSQHLTVSGVMTEVTAQSIMPIMSRNRSAKLAKHQNAGDVPQQEVKSSDEAAEEDVSNITSL